MSTAISGGAVLFRVPPSCGEPFRSAAAISASAPNEQQRAAKSFEDRFFSAVQRVGGSGKCFAEPLAFELH